MGMLFFFCISLVGSPAAVIEDVYMCVRVWVLVSVACMLTLVGV